MSRKASKTKGAPAHTSYSKARLFSRVNDVFGAFDASRQSIADGLGRGFADFARSFQGTHHSMFGCIRNITTNFFGRINRGFHSLEGNLANILAGFRCTFDGFVH